MKKFMMIFMENIPYIFVVAVLMIFLYFITIYSFSEAIYQALFLGVILTPLTSFILTIVKIVLFYEKR
jgi:hypothetical protein